VGDPYELTHTGPDASWAVVELPQRPWIAGSRAMPSEHGALILAHALGHACGVPDDVRRIGLGPAVTLSPTGGVMATYAQDLGWGDN
jgi:hypothetical protein